MLDRRTPPRGQRVLDYGCGSGILAIGAALHGAASVDAVDIDEAAAIHARQRRQRRKLVAGLPDQAQGSYDTVLANILATPLKVLAPLLCGHVAAGGALVLAGVLERHGRTAGGVSALAGARSGRCRGRLGAAGGSPP